MKTLKLKSPVRLLIKTLLISCFILLLQSTASIAQVYARLRFEDVSANTYYNTNGYQQYASSNVYIELFSDIDCTMPAYSIQDESVVVQEKGAWNGVFANMYGPWTITIPAYTQSYQLEYGFCTLDKNVDYFSSMNSYTDYYWYDINSFSGAGIGSTDNPVPYWNN